MGCGESKLAVATSNTILRRKKSNVGGDSAKKSKDIETVLEGNPNAQQQQQQQVNKDNNVENAGANVGGGGDETTSSLVVDVKDVINEDNNNDNKKKEIDDETGNNEEEEEEDGIVNGGGVIVVEDDHQQEPERLVSHGSPNRFFSTRKLDEEVLIDGIISEGQSGASDYYTPRHGSKTNLYFNQNNTAEDKQVLAATQTKPADQAQNNNGEPVKVEEKLVKEAEKETTSITAPVEAEVSGPVEAKLSGPAQEEKKKSDPKSGF